MSNKKYSLPKKRQEFHPMVPPIPLTIQEYKEIEETYNRVILHKREKSI
jgi:hypothetical protein